MDAKEAPRLQPWRLVVGAIGLAIWAYSVKNHDNGGQIFGRFFEHAKNNWGPNGRALAELTLVASAAALGVIVAALTIGKLLRSGSGRAALPELLARWALVLLGCLAADRYLICIQSECVHFAQFGFFAFVLTIATGSPRWGFAFTCLLGVLDELNQWWFIYWGELSQHLDWSDMCLDVLGAAAGALPFASYERLRRYQDGTELAPTKVDPAARVKIALGALFFSGLFAWLLLGSDLGHFPHQRPWEMLDNRKPFHTFSTREGVPALLALAFFYYFVVDERRRHVPYRALVLGLVAWHLGLTLPKEGEPVHESVPRKVVPKAKAPVTIDGVLDPKEWTGALEVELHTYAPDTARQFTGARGDKIKEMAASTFGAELPTKARLLWDEKALYVSFECATEDAWARDFARDDARIPSNNPCVEVFLDVDAAERAYFEFDVSAANRVQDLFVYWPCPPQWIPAPTNGQEFVNMNGWDAKHLATAVKVQGELDAIGADAAAQKRAKPATQGYTVEIAIPWQDLDGRAIGLEKKPHVGSVLRANLTRVDPKRPPSEATTYMTWSPTHLPLDFHRPAFFGALTLGE